MTKMNTIITSIQQEAKKKGISVWRVVEEIKLQLEIAEEQEKAEKEAKELFEKAKEDISEAKYVFLDKNDRVTIWLGYSKKDLKEDRHGYVCLKPFNFHEGAYVPKFVLQPITKEDALQLLSQLIRSGDLNHEPSDEYTAQVNELLAKEAE